MPLKAEETVARSLGESINIATRSVHTKLNKLIITRLPLAVPPQAKDPANYVCGLLHITPIYSTFELLWQNILRAPVSTEDQNETMLNADSCEGYEPPATAELDPSHRPVVCSRVQSLLKHLHATELERRENLKEDISSMTGWSLEQLEEKLTSAAESPFLSAFIDHIRRSVQERPYVLLAYAWVLYMALFSGGRFIRASLSRVDIGFWYAIAKASNNRKGPVVLPLRFLTFDAPNDGDEIKLTFKKRLAESEMLLTKEERDDIVIEAQRIFEFMVEIVGELDDVCRTDPEFKEEQQDEGIMWRMSRLLGLRARDSVTVAKERKAWAKLLSEHCVVDVDGDHDERSDEEDSSDDYNDDFERVGLERMSANTDYNSATCWHGKEHDGDARHLAFVEPKHRGGKLDVDEYAD